MTVMVVGEGGRADLLQPWLDLWAHTEKTDISALKELVRDDSIYVGNTKVVATNSQPHTGF